jgi:hypothetical protein
MKERGGSARSLYNKLEEAPNSEDLKDFVLAGRLGDGGEEVGDLFGDLLRSGAVPAS